MSRTFTKVSPSVWQSPRFRALSTEHRLVYVYFLTCGHINSAGCFYLPDGYAVTDLGIALEAYIEARASLIDSGLIDYDEATHLVRILRWFQHNPPMNQKHAIGIRQLLEKITCERLQNDALAEFEPTEQAVNEKAEAAALKRQMSDFHNGNGDAARLLKTRFMSGRGAA